eukprot:TRINITY_DN5505_c0_g1_i1.p1 TRINITY_DN5505_c0_g1~~TRINITY_DN5505_c0_g1_i1.p1  ORF type:complete len:242 (+),score=50.98 TRINITY_DN5505_c0_g1_i1:35-727(+)
MKNHSVLCFGDSWSYGNYYGMKEALRTRGITNIDLHSHYHFGATASHFASNKDLLPRHVSKHKADYVILSLGGNDMKNIYLRNKNFALPGSVLPVIEEDIRTVLKSLYDQHPKVKVVMYGYDFMGNCESWLRGSAYENLYKWVGIPLVNWGLTYLTTAMQNLEKEMKKGGYDFEYVPLWGTLQTKGGSESFSWFKPSSEEYMQDPIHANQKGFTLLMDKLYEKYFVNRLK